LVSPFALIMAEAFYLPAPRRRITIHQQLGAEFSDTGSMFLRLVLQLVLEQIPQGSERGAAFFT